MEEKEKEMARQLQKHMEELENHKQMMPLPMEDINSKKFFIHVLETRIKRHQHYANAQYAAADKKIRNDVRLTKFL